MILGGDFFTKVREDLFPQVTDPLNRYIYGQGPVNIRKTEID